MMFYFRLVRMLCPILVLFEMCVLVWFAYTTCRRLCRAPLPLPAAINQVLIRFLFASELQVIIIPATTTTTATTTSTPAPLYTIGLPRA